LRCADGYRCGTCRSFRKWDDARPAIFGNVVTDDVNGEWRSNGDLVVVLQICDSYSGRAGPFSSMWLPAIRENVSDRQGYREQQHGARDSLAVARREDRDSGGSEKEERHKRRKHVTFNKNGRHGVRDQQE